MAVIVTLGVLACAVRAVLTIADVSAVWAVALFMSATETPEKACDVFMLTCVTKARL